MRGAVLAALGAATLAAAAGAPATGWRVVDPGQGPLPLASGSTGARELSGIAWAGGPRYYAVADKGGLLFPLTIDLDAHTGTIARAALEAGVRLAGATDVEGIVYLPGRGAVLVSDEAGPAIREYRIADGRLLRSIAVPPIYRAIRKNRGLESLAADAEHGSLWTANEETLRVDGPASSAGAGSVVRLQRFDRDDRPNGQWAYRTDAVPGGGRGVESSGLSELIALPDGALIALERAFGATGFRARLYEVDRTGATDVSSLPSLRDAPYTPAAKRLLWERSSLPFNFEGAGLGPTLPDGARSLILIADDGHGFRQGLYPLILEPAP